MSKKSFPQDWHAQLPLILSAGLTRILLHGPPDTGKSTTPRKWAEAQGKPVFQLPCSRDQGLEELLGQFTLSDGATKYVKGPIPKAMESGGLLICNEFDMRNPAHDSIFHSLLDDPEICEIILANGSVIKPAPGFTVVCTTNAAPGAFTPALLRRWEVKLYCGTAHPEALKTLPENQGKFLSNLQGAQKVPELRFEFCVSSFRAAAKLAANGIEQRAALSVVFGETAAAELESALASVS